MDACWIGSSSWSILASIPAWTSNPDFLEAIMAPCHIKKVFFSPDLGLLEEAFSCCSCMVARCPWPPGLVHEEKLQFSCPSLQVSSLPTQCWRATATGSATLCINQPQKSHYAGEEGETGTHLWCSFLNTFPWPACRFGHYFQHPHLHHCWEMPYFVCCHFNPLQNFLKEQPLC